MGLQGIANMYIELFEVGSRGVTLVWTIARGGRHVNSAGFVWRETLFFKEYKFKVIKNGNKDPKKTIGTSEETNEPTLVEEKLDRRNEIKARGTLLMALPNKDQLKFHSYQDEKLLMEAVEKSTSSTNEADTTASGVSTAHTQSTTVNSTSVDNVSDAVLFAFLASRVYGRKTIPMETPIENALIAQDGIGGYDRSYQAEEEIPTNYAFMALTSLGSSSSFESEENRSDKVYHVVPSPLTGNYMPPKRDLRLIDKHFKSLSVDVISNITPSDVKTVKTIDVNHKCMFSTEEPKPVMKNNFSPLIIEDWHSDDDSKVEISPTFKVKTVKPSIERIKYVKTAREPIKNEESPKQQKRHPRGNQQNWNNLMSQRLGSNFKMINKARYVCGSFEHLQYVCDKKDVRPMRTNSNRVNNKTFANKFPHPHPKRGFVPQAVLTRLGKINTAGASVNTAAKPVNTVGSKSTVKNPRLKSKSYKRGHSQDTRPNNKFLANKNSIFNKKVNTVRVNGSTASDRAVVSGNMIREGNPQQKEYKEKGVINSGCSRIAPDLEVSRARGFVHRPLQLQSLAYGNPISQILLI
uniref:Retrotransposon Orf1 n=1 Tax=Tanacetum cinerariifolium TaxID=118510 RepID=A0A6L2JBG5_TANCI|nr:retrotransposon Orf1 [Tanacetum cinerariifolium]